MFKFFTIFFALLTLILAGCKSTNPDPQITEEPQEVEKQVDSEHVKNTLEQEKRQEKRMEELLAEMDAEAAAKEPEPEPAPIVALFGRGIETKSKAQPEQETIEVIQPEVQKSGDGNIIEKGLQTLKNLLVPSKKEQQEAPPEW